MQLLCHLTCQELLSAEVLEEEKEGKRHRNETVELMIMSDSRVMTLCQNRMNMNERFTKPINYGQKMRKIVELKQKPQRRRRLFGKPPQEEEQAEQLQHQLQKLTEEYVNFRFRFVNRVAAFLSTCTVILDADDEEFHVPNLGLGMLVFYGFFHQQNLQCKTHEKFFRAKEKIRYLEVHSNI